MNGQKRNFAYIPHLDGLRAISVLAILIFHLRSDWLPGGFLGVDVFFIISGYLITSLIVDEIDNNGRIDFARFYFRRAKRLLPSFVLVILATIISAYILFDQLKFVLVVKTALASLFGFSNVYFYKTSNYFDLSSIEKPLLHIWSLNVEEQFYLIWPFLLLLTYKFLRKRAKYFYVLISALFIVSIYFNLNHPVATFYLPFFRFYEFLIGAGLALFPKNQGVQVKDKRIMILASLFALVVVLFLFDSSTLLPGPNTIFFILPTIYLIINGGFRTKLNILELPLLKFIGRRSYTIYLVHWPIIVFYLESMSRENLTTFETFVLAILIFIVADVIYRFFETPWRTSDGSPKAFFALVVAFSFIITAISIPTLVLNKKPFSNETNIIYTQSEIENGKQLRFSTRIKICEAKGWENCDNPQLNRFNALILGDSHAVDALNAMYTVFPEFDYSMSQLGGCPPTKRMRELVPRTFPDLDGCVKLNQTRFNIDYLNKFDVIVINVLFGWYPPEELNSYLTFLKESGVKKVIVFGGYFQSKKEVPLLINQFGFNYNRLLEDMLVEDKAEPEVQKNSDKSGYLYISKRSTFCNIDRCRLWKSSIPFTWDSHHLSLEFATSLAQSNRVTLNEYLNDI